MISFGLCSLGELRDLVHVDALVVAAHVVGHRLEPLARHVDRRAVGEMAAGGEIEPHEGVARLHQREEHRGIGGGAGMRLHIGELAAEQLGHPLDRQPLGDVDELAAAVIALARQAFGIFVGENRALRLQHRARDDVLRGDQLDLVALAAEFELDRLGDLGIDLAQGRREQASTSPAGVGLWGSTSPTSRSPGAGRPGSATRSADDRDGNRFSKSAPDKSGIGRK